MRRTSRKRWIGAGALVLALGLGTATTAFGGATTETSRVVSAVYSNQQSATKAGPATLFTQVSTQKDTDATGFGGTPPTFADSAIPADGAEQVSIGFDDDIKFTVNAKLAKCTPVSIAPPSNVQDALETCSKAQVGSGSALAIVPGIGEIITTVSTFNGPTSVPGGACAGPAPATGGPDGCEFVGGNPTIVFHSRVDAPVALTQVFSGEVQAAGGVEGGRMLFVSDAPDVAGDAGAVTLFNAVVNKKWTNGKSGRRKRTYNYITATCSDGNEKYDFNATWQYDDASTDTDTHEQQCWNKIP